MKKVLLLLLFPTFLCHGQITPSAGNILYVNGNVTGGNGSGNSWSNAITQLADALKWANQNKSSWESNTLQIWVAKGTYYPMYSPEDGNFGNPDGYNNSFLMVKNVKLFGGFSGAETALNQRNPVNNEVILSGDLDKNGGFSTADAYHVLVSAGDAGTAELNGFTVTGGNALHVGFSFPSILVNNMSVLQTNGGGMYNLLSSPLVTNCIFTNNRAGLKEGIEISLSMGGGMYNFSSAPVISNCVFSHNSSRHAGGMYNYNAENTGFPTITGCIFSNNSAATSGGMDNLNTNAVISTCSFLENSASGVGGGMGISMGAPKISNCIFFSNSADDAGGLKVSQSTPVVVNCLFTENSADFVSANNFYLGLGGAAIVENSSSATFVNVTIADNSAKWKGGGLAVYGSSEVELKNSIITGNTASFDVNTNLYINLTQNSRINISNSLLGGNAGTWTWNLDDTGSDAGGNIITTEQVFNQENDDYYSLSAGSPAIDAGNNQLYTDAGGNLQNDKALNGNPRVDNFVAGGTIDMGAYEYPAVGLPVVLSAFEIRSAEGAAELYWRSSAESGTEKFEIERSREGRIWEKIGVTAAGSHSNTPRDYFFTDTQPLDGLNFYRLKMIDLDGTFAYSPIRSIRMETPSDFRIYPNPAKDYVTIEMPPSMKGSKITLSDVGGIPLKQIEADREVVTIDLRNLSPGVYLIRNSDGRVRKIVKR